MSTWPPPCSAQVDAAIGGKTGVNLPEGKNLVGAFWQPRAVLCDTDALATLPPREWASGRGEMAKYALLAGTPGVAVPDGAALLELPLDEQVAACARAKADVVAADEREGRRRVVLNYGHTLAHALEAAAFDDRAGTGLRARGGGGRRAGVRRAPRPPAGPDRRGPGPTAPAGRRALRPVAAAARRGATRNGWSPSWAGTRRPVATSPSSSTGRTESSRCRASIPTRWWLPWRRWSGNGGGERA